MILRLAIPPSPDLGFSMTIHIHKQKAYLRGVVLAVDITETIEPEKMNCAPDGYLRHMLAQRTDSEVSVYEDWKRDRLWEALSAHVHDLNRVIAEEWPIGTTTAVGCMYRIRSKRFQQVYDDIYSALGFGPIEDQENASFHIGRTKSRREVRLTKVESINEDEILIDYEFEKGIHLHTWGMELEKHITVKESQFRITDVDNTLCVIAPGHNMMVTRQLFEGVSELIGDDFTPSSDLDGFVNYEQSDIVLWFQGLPHYELKTLRASDHRGSIAEMTLTARVDQDLGAIASVDTIVDGQLNDSVHKSKLLSCAYLHENGFIESISVYLSYKGSYMGVGFSKGISYSGRLQVMRELLELRSE